MSFGLNSQFRKATRGFISQMAISAKAIQAGGAHGAGFDLRIPSTVKGPTVHLGDWGAGSRSDEILPGYWVPQGGYCDIPKTPEEKCFVFTPDFSGCSLLVDQIGNDAYRVYHVQGGSARLQPEYYRRHDSTPQRLGLAAAMTFGDYGHVCGDRFGMGQVRTERRGFAFLKYEQGRWWIYFQGQHELTDLNCDASRNPLTLGVRNGGRIPVADLTCEVPRINARHDPQVERKRNEACLPPKAPLHDLPISRQIKTQRRLLPNDEVWAGFSPAFGH